MSTEDGTSSKSVRDLPPHQRILRQLQATEVQLLANLASSARDGDWMAVDDLFDTLPALHQAICHATDPPREEAIAGEPSPAVPSLAPPSPCPAVTDQLLALSGVEKAVQKALADALAELASLAHDDHWPAVAAALPVVTLLNYARRQFQRPQ